MRLRELASTHLTYCTNVHPGESWSEVHAALQTHVVDVKNRISPTAPFGIGLRLAAQACRELEAPDVLAQTRRELDAQGLYVFTLNGFPYGAFHDTRVKERVYEPDWTSPERFAYTQALARVLAALLPDGERGSISTVPGCFKPRADRSAQSAMLQNLVRAVANLIHIQRETGRFIQLALEPEPHCFLETIEETLAFFETQVWTSDTFHQLSKLCGLDPASAERRLREHLGVCLDTCHAAVEFEAPLEVFRKLQAAGIAVPKIQISAGLRVPQLNREMMSALGAFAEDVYLHQTVARGAGGLRRYVDLPEALASAPEPSDEWRIHFHVPVFRRELGMFESTQADLIPLLQALRDETTCPHLEVETYTWGVLPLEFRELPIADAIAQELTWTMSQLRRSA